MALRAFRPTLRLESAEQIERRREAARKAAESASQVRPVPHWLGVVAQTLEGAKAGWELKHADKADAAGRDRRLKAISDHLLRGGQASAPGGDMAPADIAGPAMSPSPRSVSAAPTDPSVYQPFIETVKAGGLTNPHALAAVAATGQAESGFSAGNAYRQWSDPSQSGQPGMAGGIMSWRADRLKNLRRFAAERGDDSARPSPETQAAFFLSEDPNLVTGLQGARSVEEAQQLMNNAWRFAGYDQPGGEAANRLATAQAYLPQFAGGGPSATPASFDASASSGMAYAGPGLSAQPTPLAALSGPSGAGSMAGLQPLQPTSSGTPGQEGAPFGNQQALASQLTGQNPQIPGNRQAPTAPRAGYDTAIIAQLMGDPYTEDLAQMMLAQNMEGRNAKPIVMGDRLIDPNTYEVIQDFSGPPDRDTATVGNSVIDVNTGQPIYTALADPLKPTPDIQNYDAYATDERDAGRQPLGRLEYETALKQAGRSVSEVNIDQKAEGAFEKAGAEALAKRYAETEADGMNARSDLAMVQELRGLSGQIVTGGAAALRAFAGNYGIQIGEDLGDIQAFEALVNKLVPTQRPPGSGTMSDRDVSLFKSSLPRLINTPEGNSLIMDTMEAMARYRMAQGDIAAQVLSGDVTRQDGIKAMRELPDPLGAFREWKKRGGTSANPVSQMSDDELLRALGGQ